MHKKHAEKEVHKEIAQHRNSQNIHKKLDKKNHGKNFTEKMHRKSIHKNAQKKCTKKVHRKNAQKNALKKCTQKMHRKVQRVAGSNQLYFSIALHVTGSYGVPYYIIVFIQCDYFGEVKEPVL